MNPRCSPAAIGDLTLRLCHHRGARRSHCLVSRGNLKSVHEITATGYYLLSSYPQRTAQRIQARHMQFHVFQGRQITGFEAFAFCACQQTTMHRHGLSAVFHGVNRGQLAVFQQWIMWILMRAAFAHDALFVPTQHHVQQTHVAAVGDQLAKFFTADQLPVTQLSFDQLLIDQHGKHSTLRLNSPK